MAASAALVLFPRFTTLVGASIYTSAPVDVADFSAAQFQLWRSKILGAGSNPFRAFLEESLDAEAWSGTGNSTRCFDPGENQRMIFNYTFRLRWFRIRIVTNSSLVTVWAEGLLR